MPRYYFDFQTTRGDHHDDIGDVIGTLDEAREIAQSILPDMVRNEPLGKNYTVICEVRDEIDRVVYRGRLAYQDMRS